MLDQTVIELIGRSNPHRYGSQFANGSMDWRRWALIQPGMTIGEFVAAHNAQGDLGVRWHAIRYLRVMLERGGILRLPGVTPDMLTRGPRATNVVSNVQTIFVDPFSFTFGVEFEVLLPANMTHADAAAKVTAMGIECHQARYGHTTQASWKVVTDGSLGSYTQGAEFVSPIFSGAEGIEQVEKMARALKAIGCKVDRRCGFHVHCGARTEHGNFFARLLKLYAGNEKQIDSFMPHSRRDNNNRFCRKTNTRHARAGTMNGEYAMLHLRRRNHNVTRLHKVNVSAFFRHGTVEFRHHNGTVEHDKATNWVMFCLRACAFAKSDAKLFKASTVDALVQRLNGSSAEREYFNARAQKFAERTSPVVTQTPF